MFGKIKNKIADIVLLLPAFTIGRLFNLFFFYINSWLGFTKVFCQPISVDIEPTIDCNLACPFCHNKELVREKRNMSLAEFIQALDNFSLAIRINIQGMGEPLLNIDIAKMIKYAKSKKHFVTITTNGTLLTPEKAEELFASGLDRLIISMDSVDPTIYKMMRPGAELEKVKENISKLVAIRGKRKTKIMFWTLVLEKTQVGLADVISFASDCQIDAVNLQLNISDWGKIKWRNVNAHLVSDSIGINVLVAVKKAEQLKVKMRIHEKISGFKSDKISRCLAPWGSAYVTSDGRLTPCCLAPDPNTVSLGTINNETKLNWNSLNYQQLRLALKVGKIPDYCKQCYENPTNK